MQGLARSLTIGAGVAVAASVAVWGGIPFLLAGGGAVALYFGVELLWPKSSENLLGPERPENPAELLASAQAKVSTLRRTAQDLPAALRDDALAIAETAQEIIAEMTKNPRDLQRSRRFVTYYLDSTLTVADSYRDLRRRGTSQLAAVEVKLSEVMHRVRTSFAQQRESLMEDDLLKLQTEMDVLRKTVELEG
jgi:hypothetical protein